MGIAIDCINFIQFARKLAVKIQEGVREYEDKIFLRDSSRNNVMFKRVCCSSFRNDALNENLTGLQTDGQSFGSN